MNEYSEYYKTLQSLFDNGTYSYTGTFDQESLTSIYRYIETIAESKSGLRSKLFKIFVEMAQNISQNSADKQAVEGMEIGAGCVHILDFDEYFEIISGNPVRSEDVQKLSEKCDYINKSNREELRNFKRNSRKSSHSNTGNGNIGLIQIALISGFEMKYKINTILENKYFFTIRVRIGKN
jgi:hypothetical protein